LTGSAIDATLVWLNNAPALLNKRYRLKHSARLEWAELKSIRHRVNINSLEHEHAGTLEMNEIGSVHLQVARPLAFDTYTQNRATGSFILIDEATNATVAAGLISGAAQDGRKSLFGPITVSDRITRVSIQTASGRTQTFTLPGDDAEAQYAIEELLYRIRERFPEPDWTESGGI
jgi:sulfate adenylyltransferase subunit 1 (EFTu-like GTPase family)